MNLTKTPIPCENLKPIHNPSSGQGSLRSVSKAAQQRICSLSKKQMNCSDIHVQLASAKRMGENQIATALRTLLINGYAVTKVHRLSTSATVISVQKRDLLGGLARSVVLFANNPSKNVLEMLSRTAAENGAQSLIVTTSVLEVLDQQNVPVLVPEKFFCLLGGEIRSALLTRDDLPEVFDALGHNRAYPGLTTSPDELLEDYVKEGLQFLLDSRAHRYGQERLFESLPDGLVLGRKGLNLYFDTKAYENGFHPTADDIKRFASYVTDFNQRYEGFVGRLHCFLVVSGHFNGGGNALETKASDFYSFCSTRLCHITGKDLGQIISNIQKRCRNRTAVNWRKVLSQLLIKPDSVMKEISRIEKDNVIGA